MRPGKRFGLSAAQKDDMWCRWKAEQSLHEIGRAFGKEHSSIRCLVSRNGGIVPAVRGRSLRVLTAVEREDISRGLASGSSIREIAKRLERVASTVSREVPRHGGRSVYRAKEADDQAWASALRPKRCLLAVPSWWKSLSDLQRRQLEYLANRNPHHGGICFTRSRFVPWKILGVKTV
jgi:Helix-turn-helix domain